MHKESLSEHLLVDTYGDFRLSEAVRPGIKGGIAPREGYRISRFQERGLDVPVLIAAASQDKLFDLLIDVLSVLSPVVDVVLETSHEEEAGQAAGRKKERFREGIDLPILESYLCEHEDLLLNDGCLGLAVIDRDTNSEVQFDEHKVFFIYADDLTPFEEVLQKHGLRRDDRLAFIMEAEHMHITHPRFNEAIEQLCCHLGIIESMAFCP